MPTQAHEVRLHDDTHASALTASCMNLTIAAITLSPRQCLCTLLSTMAMTHHEHDQLCMQAELDQSDHAVLWLLPLHLSLCYPSLQHRQTLRAPQRPYSHRHTISATCKPMLPQTATLQHCLQCHDIEVVQHYLASSMTAIPCTYTNALQA